MFDRIVSNFKILGGKPCIRGTRISVSHIMELFASGGSHGEILQNYPQLAPEDLEQALRYASRFLGNEILISAEIIPNDETNP